MSNRTYEDYIKNDCHPVGYNEPCQSYYFAQSSVDLLLNKIDLLKQQLEEKDKMHLLDEKEFQNYCAYKWIEPEIKGCLDREREYKQQLVEKDKEIESLTNRTNRYENMFRSRINYTGDMQKDIELYVKQLAIQELEKVKNYCDKQFNLWENNYLDETYDNKDIAHAYYDIIFSIQERIKELKGE